MVKFNSHAKDESNVIDIQQLIGHTCHHLSQSNGITKAPIQAPMTVIIMMNLADLSFFFNLSNAISSNTCVYDTPQKMRSGNTVSMLNKALNTNVSVIMLKYGAPNIKAAM